MRSTYIDSIKESAAQLASAEINSLRYIHREQARNFRREEGTVLHNIRWG